MSRWATSTKTSSRSRQRRARCSVIGHRAVAPSGAADGDREVRLALGHVLGQQVVQQRLEALVEGLELPVAPDVVDDRWSWPVSGRRSGS
jgi:hypothetical protein